MQSALDEPAGIPSVLAITARERARQLLKRTLPKRRAKLVLVRTLAEFKREFRRSLVDAAIVDIAQPVDDTWSAVTMARDFPSVPFFALASLRVADAGAIARCVELDFADVLAEGIDDAALGEMVLAQAFTRRFGEALSTAAPELGLDTPLQQRAWRTVVSQGGRRLTTGEVAAQLQITREHLSRTFATAGKPNLKRIIDLVRLIAAAELAKNPGHDVTDVARILGFASVSHLSTTAQRILGAKSASLARLRTADLIARFRQDRGRSRKRV